MLNRKGLIFILTLLPLLAFAQESDPNWYNGKEIKDIRFEGLKTVLKSELNGVVRPFIGQDFSDAVFRDLQSRLYALEYFDGLIVPNAIPGDKQRESVIILFKVTEKPLVDGIRFTGNDEVRRTELMEVIVTKIDDMYRKSRIQLDEEAIVNLYKQKGFAKASVESRVEKDEERNEITLFFEISEGIQTTIKEITFEGNTFASESTLKKVMESKAKSFFNPGPYQETQLNRDLRNIESYYWEKGYADAKVIDVERVYSESEDENRQEISINILIDESTQFLYGGLTLQGNKVFSDERLMEEVRQKEGAVLNRVLLEADFARITDVYYENGYVFNTIEKEEIRQDDTISYLVKIVERPRAHIRDVVVKGNDRTKDEVILREIPLEPGEVFSKTKFTEGYQNLMRLQYFNSVLPETPVTDDGLIDLIFNVEEGHTADIILGIAFSGATDFPVSGQVKWQDRNFLGRGQTFGIEGNFSPLSQSLSLNFQEDWLAGRRWSGGINFSFTHNLQQDIPQDIMNPIFNDEDNSIADPYDGHYVFSSDYTDTATDSAGLNRNYKAGEAFPYAITDSSWISEYNLKRDYEYFSDEDTSGLMEYDEYNFTLGLSTGYTWHTGLGRFNLSTSVSTGLEMLDYDDGQYRPAEYAIREAKGEWDWQNKLTIGGSWDTRDLYYDATKGQRFAHRTTFAGGFLGGNLHYTRNQSTLEAYQTLWDFPIGESFDFKGVLKLKSTGTAITDPLGGSSLNVGNTTNLLRIDGMFTGRGWQNLSETGEVLWDNKAEIRMPLVPGVLSFDFILDAVALFGSDTQNLSGDDSPLNSFDDITRDDFYFSYGFGPRFAIPNFPLAFYWVRPFGYVDDKWEFSDGSAWGDMSFILTFGIDIF